jgi:L-threonylcarbamoyladenylate synthase
MACPEPVMLDTCLDAELCHLSERIVSGAVAVFPTDTVYGIGCSAACAPSVARVFAIKHRDACKPLPVFVPDAFSALPWVDSSSRRVFERLAAAFWPGALTIVVDVVRSGLFTQPSSSEGARSIGFRAPRHAGLLRLLANGLFIAQTSLNESGEPVVASLDSPEAVELLEKVDLVLDSRQKPEGQPSTVIRLAAGSWSMLREGGISLGEVASAMGEESG